MKRNERNQKAISWSISEDQKPIGERLKASICAGKQAHSAFNIRKYERAYIYMTPGLPE